MPKKPTFIRNVPTLDGPKKYEFVSVTRRDAVKVAHTSLLTVVQAIGTASDLLFAQIKGIDLQDQSNWGPVLDGVSRSLATLDFDKVWALAEVVLRGVVVDDDELINDINETDYFGDNIDEFYTALVVGIEGNFPKVFTRLRGRLDDSGLVEKAKKAAASIGTSGTSGTP